MRPEVYQEALYEYGNPFHDFIVETLQGGLIHRTYKVTPKQSPYSFLLQQVNHDVFADPVALQANYELIWKHLGETDNLFTIPEPKLFPGDINLYTDSQGNFWRVTEFISGSTTHERAQTPADAKKVAGIFARFTAALSHFDPALLTETIPGFHDPGLRFDQFLAAAKQNNSVLTPVPASILTGITERERYVNFFEVVTQSPEFRCRVMHHDAKISNVLFDSETGDVICPVDFDTVMPGFIFSDLGDMIRSMAGCFDEHSADLSGLCIREDYYRGIVDTYTDILGDQLTGAEKKYIHFSGLLITYMQVLRYLTDYMNGNIYYQCSYPSQNLDRALNQFALLESLEQFLEKNYGFRI